MAGHGHGPGPARTAFNRLHCVLKHIPNTNNPRPAAALRLRWHSISQPLTKRGGRGDIGLGVVLKACRALVRHQQ
jgi:hypothetical protein